MNNELVGYSNGPNLFDHWMVQTYSNIDWFVIQVMALINKGLVTDSGHGFSKKLTIARHLYGEK